MNGYLEDIEFQVNTAGIGNLVSVKATHIPTGLTWVAIDYSRTKAMRDVTDVVKSYIDQAE